MEDQALAAADFDCVHYIEKALQGSDLTDLTFQLQLTVEESEEKMQQAAQVILQNKDQIALDAQELFKSLIEYKQIQDEYIAQVAPHLNQDPTIYSKLEECLRYRTNIQQSLEMLDTVKQLDQIHDAFQRVVDENDTQELYQLVLKHETIFKILLRLPKMNPRYGQMEKIIQLIEQHCHTQFFESKNFTRKIEILNLLGIASRASHIYVEQRVKQMDFTSLERSDITVSDAQEITHQMIQRMENELQYLTNLQSFQVFLYEFVRYMISYFNKHVFRHFFSFDNHYNKNMDILYAYLTFYQVLQSYYDRGFLVKFTELLKLGFEPYCALLKVVIKNEQTFLHQNLLQRVLDAKTLTGKLDQINFNSQEILEQSFKRSIDLSFEIAYEDWIMECVKILDNLLINLNTLLDELPMDPLGHLIQAILSHKHLPELQAYQSKFSIKTNFNLFETLLIKHYELHNFRTNALTELDNFIRANLENQERDELNRQISAVLREKLQIPKGRTYSDNLSIASQLRVAAEEREQKLTLHILRLLLHASFNQELDPFQNFTSNLELVENLYKQIKPQKISLQSCVALNPKLSYDDLEEKCRHRNDYFSQPTCYWAIMQILVEQRVKKVPAMWQIYEKFVPNVD